LDFLFPIEIRDRVQLDHYLQQCLDAGHEGVMVRDPFGGYKYGRATLKQGWLTKVKPFEDAEATIIGFEEQMRNGNEATTDNLGHTERSSHKANLVPKGTLGALVVESEKFGQFNIGTGFDDAFRAEVWANRAYYQGKLVTFRYQAIGTKDKPRIPSFKGIRNPSDL
jgi:DNA ligase-1